MVNLSEYGKKYPYLVWDIRLFFADDSRKSMYAKNLEIQRVNPHFSFKCALDFFAEKHNQYREIDAQYDNSPIQPRTISKICDILCDNGMMSRMFISGISNIDGGIYFYKTFLQKQENEILNGKEFLARYLNNIVYGFPYIYESNRKNVRPVWVKKNDQNYNGTCFNTIIGIVTAKHCIDCYDEIQIEGISAEVLSSAKVFTLDDIDLLLIQPQNDYNWSDKFLPGDGEILDEVMVMGYPNHCGFDRFLTATTGAIAAIEQPYLEKYRLMLLTGRIKGGNSGGPVLNKKGQVVGIVTETADPEGSYDKFGYGMAIPSSYLKELVEIDNNYNFVNSIS